MKKILFVCKASQKEGTGHIRRTLFLSKILESKTKILFFGEKRLGNNIFSKAIHIKKFSEIFKMVDNFCPEWIVLDRQKNSSMLVKRLKKLGLKILLIEDDSYAGDHVDLVWDANIKSNKKNYITGFKNVLLNPELFRFKKKTNPEKINDIFISLGGTDVNNNIPVIIESLDNKGFELKIFPGSGNLDYLNYNKSGVKIYSDKDNLYEVASKCDLAIVSGGITMYEMIALGLPAIVWPQVKHQEKNAKILAEKELIQTVSNIEDLLRLINTLTDNIQKYTCFFKRIKGLDLSAGLKKVKNILED